MTNTLTNPAVVFTVGELKAALVNLPDDMPIVLPQLLGQKDQSLIIAEIDVEAFLDGTRA